MQDKIFVLYGEQFQLVDYKVDRKNYDYDAEFEEVSKKVMIKNINSGNTLTFILNGIDSQLENLGIVSVDAINSKVFNNLISNQNFFYNNLLTNDVVLSADLDTSTSVRVLGDRKFEDLKQYDEFMKNLNECELQYNVLEYDEESNSLLKAKHVK